MTKNFDIEDINLAPEGKKRILWANKDMPVLEQIRDRFGEEKPLAGLKMACCLHITAETANLARTLKDGGADIVLCASNPLSTQNDIAASLVKDFDIPVFAIHAEDNTTYYNHINEAIKHFPNITMDDGADLVSEILKNHPELHSTLYGSMEETTTGVIRLRAMEKDNVLKFPIVAVNDAHTKYMFDNRYGTGQSTLDGIIRATDILLAGSTFAVAGYGWCGRGLAAKAKGMGANVIVTEVEPIKALEASMDGFRVMPMKEAAQYADLICTVTGDIDVISEDHFENIKDGCYICNAGHFDVEIDTKALSKLSTKINKNVRKHVDEYILNNGKKIYLLAEGRLVNLSAAEGHPASVMDMSFSTQALGAEFLIANRDKLKNKVYTLPYEIEHKIASIKLKSKNINIDELSEKQKAYLSSWESGT